MNPQKIARGYSTQLIKGCDNIDCQNEYCRSCKNFKFSNELSDDPDLLKTKAKLKDLLSNHTKEDHLCKGLLLLYFDTKDLEEKAEEFYSLITSIDFTAVKIEFDQEKVVSYMKNFDLLPYIFSPGGKLDDNKIDQLFDFIVKNNKAEPFSTLLNVLKNFISSLIKSPILNTRYHFNQSIVLLAYLSLFPVDEFSEMFSTVTQHIIQLIKSDEVYNYFQSQFSKVPKLIKRILSYSQYNLTYAALDEQDPQGPVLTSIAQLFTLLRKSDITIPSSLFSNEFFTTQVLDEKAEVEKMIRRGDSFKYIKYPAVLTLPFKFNCLSLIYQIIQLSFSEEEFIRMLFSPQDNRFFLIRIQRSNIYEKTMEIISHAKPQQLSRHLRVVFEGEEGVDAGGVSREFFYLNCNEIFSDKYGIFYRLKNNKYWFQWSTLTAEPIMFKTLGTLVFLAVYNSIILPIRFPVLLYKKLFHVPVSIEDYREIDAELVDSFVQLRKMKENGEDISNSDLTFSITRDDFGATLEIPLCEGGENKAVTNDNLEEYIECYGDWLMNKSIEKQFRNFENGFNILANAQNSVLSNLHLMYNLFNYDELDILVSGQEIVNWEELKVNAVYVDGYTKDSPQVKWFWEIFDEMTEQQKQNFFRFSTGSDRAPAGGLGFFHLKIQRINDSSKLPVAHTCMNIFALPIYESKEEMKKKVLIAIENTEGFGLI
ncbi:Ubiquitin-protein ligase E3A [Tritrichomonas musculus]|uniref:HECT-type E3 ubiquitin transferase n=1 Tax=Tritrichomonas musculus TaxID=1915356 RepID=A0ABR2KK74_9EUKA